jgi:hypothetical protein
LPIVAKASLKMKVAADQGYLNEANADLVRQAPCDLAIPLDVFRLNEKAELVWYSGVAFDDKACPIFCQVANHAIDSGREAKDN